MFQNTKIRFNLTVNNDADYPLSVGQIKHQ